MCQKLRRVVNNSTIERRLSVTNLSSENNFADVSTECSSRHQGESQNVGKVIFQTQVGNR